MESSEQISFHCDLSSTDSLIPLGLRIALDGTVIYENSHVTDRQRFEYKLSDSDAAHELTFELFGKRPEHTKIDKDGNIVSDALLLIDNFTVDDIKISQIVENLAIYTHDFNGSQPLTQDKFHGSLGCNGTVTLKFTTPVYLWLLENM